MTADGTEQLFDGPTTEKEVREMLIEVGLQANEQGLADFAIDQMFEDVHGKLRRCGYDRATYNTGSEQSGGAEDA